VTDWRIPSAVGALCLLASFVAEDAQRASPPPDLTAAFAAQGIHLDVAKGICTIPASILVREDLLEYVLVNPHGQAHESMFTTDVVPSVLNVALLALGVKPGQNASWVLRDPKPTEAEIKDGVSPYVVVPPTGDGLYFYAAWKSGGETYFYRVEDLVLDRSTGATMRRHKWVFLGSRMIKPRADKPDEAFAADVEGNLVNLALFEQGNTLFTAALPECLKQTIWMTNFWLVPPRDAKVELVFSRERLVSLPSEIEARLPIVAQEPPAPNGR
jgi:hypothetical protein